MKPPSEPDLLYSVVQFVVLLNSCPFVVLYPTDYVFLCFVPFVLFVLLNGLFVSIRVHSWFNNTPDYVFLCFVPFVCFVVKSFF